MKTLPLFTLVTFLSFTPTIRAQKAPELGYIFPPGGKAGAAIDVKLGGYDWTPDMEFFVHDKRVQLSAAGPLGPILIPPPPYWFGAKGRLTGPPLAREIPAKLVIPADVPPGPILWQTANANGGTSAGVFIVGSGPETLEVEGKEPQLLASLPMTVNGRLYKNEEVDRYRFVAAKDGPITCSWMARRLGAKFLGILQVHDAKGKLLADVAGASGADGALTFLAKAGGEYVVSLHDVDFGGDISYVYRLSVTQGPQVLAASPAAGKRGETREVSFVVATGPAKVETIKRPVAFTAAGPHFDYSLETPWGPAAPVRLFVSDLPESVRAPRLEKKLEPLALPCGITGTLDQADAEDRYACAWKKGETWSLTLDARRLGSPLDVALTIIGPDGKELARNDDLPGTTDAGLDFTAPADSTYQIVVSDLAGRSGTPGSTYRLAIRQPAPDFSLSVPAQRQSVTLGGKFDLPVKAVRTGGFKGPIALTVTGLPAGVSVPPNLVIPADKADLVVPLQAAKDAGSAAALVTITGAAASITRTALAPATFNLAPRGPEEAHLPNLLIAATMKQRFKGRPVDADTGRKVHLGSTFPAEVIIERLEGFQGDITLQMAATQSYQLQGSTGGEVKVPPGVKLAIYPCYMPEWLESTRTSRMGMIAVAQVPDPKGKVRHLVSPITGFITMTMEGALLKIAAEDREMSAAPGQPFDVRLRISRLAKLAEPARLELRLPEELTGKFKAEPVVVPVGKDTAVVRVTPIAGLTGFHTFSIRATALQDGRYPAISETQLTVQLATTASRAP